MTVAAPPACLECGRLITPGARRCAACATRVRMAGQPFPGQRVPTVGGLPPGGGATVLQVSREDLELLLDESRRSREFSEWLDVMLGVATVEHRRDLERSEIGGGAAYEAGRRQGLVDALRTVWATLHETTRETSGGPAQNR